MARRYLVTGAAGFIGSHTCEALLSRGDRVVGLDNFNDYYDPRIKRRSAAEVATYGGARFELIEGDIRDRDLLARLASTPFDAIIHLAAMAGVRASVEAPHYYFDVNLTGTLNLLELARPARTHFVFASTSSAYGRTTRIPFVETDSADRPLAPYPASKRAGELLGHSYVHLHGMSFTALRFFTVYGPRNRPDMMAHMVLDNIRHGKTVRLYNNGNMHRDWTFVSDIVDGVVRAADRPMGYEVINLGRGEPVRLGDFVAELERVTGRSATLLDGPMPDADVEVTFANVDKARQLLGYNPQVSVDDGVRRLYGWYDTRRAG